MNVWICIAYDPLPGIDHTTRLLRYGTLAEQLSAQGHNVVLWTSTYDHWRKSQRFDTDKSVKQSDRLTIELIHAPQYRRNVSFERIRHNRRLAHQFSSRARTFARPDVIFAGIPCLELTQSVVAYARENGVRVVVDVQDIWPEVYVTVLPKVLRPLGRLLLRSEYARARWIFRHATAVTAVSQQYLKWAQQIRGCPNDNDRVFHLGYRAPSAEVLAAAKANSHEFLARMELPVGRMFAVFLGQFAASYDVETVVEAARRLNRAVPNLHFILAGSGDKMARVRRQAIGLSSITLTGWLEYRDTVTLLQSAHIGLAAYAKTAPQSLPYKPFEYMAFGLPIISSLQGELRDLIEVHHLGSWYQAGDPSSLTTAITRLASSTEVRELASRHALELFASKYDALLITSKIIDHLTQLAQRRS